MPDRMTAEELRELQAQPKGAGPNKFSAQRVNVNGISFDSKKEAGRWAELVLLERGGEISGLRRQVPIDLHGRDGPLLTRTGRVMRLTLDFAYFDHKAGLTIFEDSKGVATRDYEVRRAVAAAQGVEVLET